MLYFLIALVVALLFVGLTIIDRCNKLIAGVQWLQDRFLSKSPSTGTVWRLDLAHEFFTMKEQLAPILLMPLVSIANTITRANESVNKEFEKSLKLWDKYELEEMEDFDKSNPPEGEELVDSDKLKSALKQWAGECNKLNIVLGWIKTFQEVYLNLISGKINIKNAENKLKCVNSYVIYCTNDVEVDLIYNDWTTKWSADNWKQRLEHLRSMKKADEEFQLEMRKIDILSDRGY